MPIDPTKFYLGVNIGWLNGAYGHDLGRAFNGVSPAEPPPEPSSLPSDPSSDPQSDRLQNQTFFDIIHAYFEHLNRRQIKVVRMWLLEQLEGMTFTGRDPLKPAKGDSFGLDHYSTYVEPRIRIIMREAKARNIQIYWCLLDAAGVLPGNKPPLWYGHLLNHLIKRACNNFKNDVLLPFLNSITPYKENVFAIDIANEVDWLWSKDRDKSTDEKREVKEKPSRSSVAGFTKELYKFINSYDPSLKTTVSFAKYSELCRDSDFDFIDFYDYHRYFNRNLGGSSKSVKSDLKDLENSDNGTLQKWTKSKPCVIGEVGHCYPDKSNPTQAVHEKDQAESSKTIMYDALSKNYSGVLLWRYAPVGDAHRLLRITKSDTGELCYPLNKFLQKFIAAVSSTTPIENPFIEFERLIWVEVEKFTQEIVRQGKMP